jgi:hypothetical protein
MAGMKVLLASFVNHAALELAALGGVTAGSGLAIRFQLEVGSMLGLPNRWKSDKLYQVAQIVSQVTTDEATEDANLTNLPFFL